MIVLLLNVTIVSAIVAAAVLASRRLLRGSPARFGFVLVAAAFAASVLLPIVAPRTALVQATAQAAPANGNLDTATLTATLIWLAGAALLGIAYTAAHIVSMRSRRLWTLASEALRDSLAWPDDVMLFTARGTLIATHGLLRPVIVADAAALATIDPDAARRLARHELAHARWRDPLVKTLARLTCIAFWPALPLWFLERELRRLQEVACDESALRGSDEASRGTYASALLEAVRHRTSGSASFASGDGNGFAARIALVLEPRRRHALAAAGAAAVIAAATVIAAPAQLPVRVSVSVARVANAPMTIETAALDVVAHTEASGRPLALPDLVLRNDTDSAIAAFAFRVWEGDRFVGAIREEIRLGPRGTAHFRQPYGSPPNLHIRNPRSAVRIELLKVEFANGRRWGFFGDPTRP